MQANCSKMKRWFGDLEEDVMLVESRTAWYSTLLCPLDGELFNNNKHALGINLEPMDCSSPMR